MSLELSELGFETEDDPSIFSEMSTEFLGNSSTDALNLSIEASPTDCSTKDESKAASTPGTCSRYGRARAVPNFARMIDPLSNRSTSHSSISVRTQGLAGPDEMGPKSYSQLVDKVHELVGKIGVTVLACSLDNGVAHSEKYIGVRPKQTQFAAVIKKNHSEIHLGVYPTAAEAARAYDMAALLSQGERAKVNFSDSTELFHLHSGIEIGPAIVSHSERPKFTDMQAAAVVPVLTTAPLTLNVSDACEQPSVEATPAPDPALKMFGGMLDDLANRLPYAAVSSSATADWEEFYHKNECLMEVSDLAQQLIWFSSQVLKDAQTESWQELVGEWVESCGKIENVEQAVALLQRYEKEALNWDHINALWEAQEAQEAQDAQSARQAMEASDDLERGSEFLSTTSIQGLEKLDDAAHGSGSKRKFFEGDSSDLDPNVAHFLDLNFHLLEDVDASPRSRDVSRLKATPGGPARTGIEASLELIRQSRASMQSSVSKSKRDYGKHARKLLKSKMQAGLKSITTEGRIIENKLRTVPPGSGIGRVLKGRGLRCRYCGKEFTHPPAHLQHERAHLQQRDIANPASRLFHSPPKLHHKRPRDGVTIDDDADPASAVLSSKPTFSGLSAGANEQVAEASKELIALAQRLPVCVWKEHDSARWEKFEEIVRKCSDLADICKQLVWLSSQLDPRVLHHAWQSKGELIGEEFAAWQGQCRSCESTASLVDLIHVLERKGLDSQAISRISASDASRLGPQECPLAVPATVGGILIPGDGEGEWEVESPAGGSVELGMPCGACQAQTKGIAACFAQGHLFVTPQGEEPTSCRECKLRNKGALFCFKRGHMPYLVPCTVGCYASANVGPASSCESPAEPRTSPPA